MATDAPISAQSALKLHKASPRAVPKVSIGMPVYNGEPCIRKALDSLVAQTFTHFELIISDNASTDGTEAICKEYAAKDARIRYVRQPINLGAIENFEFVLDQAIGEYFMWAAADDIRSKNFLDLNYQFLLKNPQFSASISPVRFSNGNFDPISMGDSPLIDDNNSIRILNFFNGWHANGRFYSLIRRKLLINFPYRHQDYLGADWAWVIHLSKCGKMNRINEGFVVLGVAGASNTTNVFRKYNKDLFSFIAPFRILSSHSLRMSSKMTPTIKLRLISKLFHLNISALKLNISWSIKGRR